MSPKSGKRNHGAEKRISCKRCQKRKIKCSRTVPCRSCSEAGVSCEFRNGDFKRPPPSRDYVSALERKVAVLESYLANDKCRDGNVISSVQDSFIPQQTASGGSEDLRSHCCCEPPTEQLYDPSTPDILASCHDQGLKTTLFSSTMDKLPTPFKADEHELLKPLINSCVDLFFKWQFPCNLIIDNECFFEEAFGPGKTRCFSSEALVMSICSLGALMSTEQTTRQTASHFALLAQRTLLDSDFGVCHITAVQALICCSWFAAGNGEHTKAQQYHQMAIQMNQELESFRTSTDMLREGTLARDSFDAESRWRTFRNCTISDKSSPLFYQRLIC